MPDAMQPEAQNLVDQTRSRMMDFRNYCSERIKEHQEAQEFWMKEVATINTFLVENQLDSSPLAVEELRSEHTPGHRGTLTAEEKASRERLSRF